MLRCAIHHLRTVPYFYVILLVYSIYNVRMSNHSLCYLPFVVLHCHMLLKALGRCIMKYSTVFALVQKTKLWNPWMENVVTFIAYKIKARLKLSFSLDKAPPTHPPSPSRQKTDYYFLPQSPSLLPHEGHPSTPLLIHVCVTNPSQVSWEQKRISATVITYHMDSWGPGCHQSRWSRSSHRRLLRIWPAEFKGKWVFIWRRVFAGNLLRVPADRSHIPSDGYFMAKWKMPVNSFADNATGSINW